MEIILGFLDILWLIACIIDTVLYLTIKKLMSLHNSALVTLPQGFNCTTPTTMFYF